MQSNYLTQISLFPQSRQTFNSLQRTWAELTNTVMVWLRRYQHRQELRELLGNDQRFFSDIGISRATFYRESEKWFWQE
jgi:uncharacterized protein YjiS (DUF1127 family)